MANLDDLTAEVANTKTVIDSAIVLINGIAARIAAAGPDPTKLEDLRASLASEAQALGAAVQANTVSAPTNPANPTGPNP